MEESEFAVVALIRLIAKVTGSEERTLGVTRVGEVKDGVMVWGNLE